MASLDKVFKEASVKKVMHKAVKVASGRQTRFANMAFWQRGAPQQRVHAAAQLVRAPPAACRLQLFKDLLILAQYLGRRVSRRAVACSRQRGCAALRRAKPACPRRARTRRRACRPPLSSSMPTPHCTPRAARQRGGAQGPGAAAVPAKHVRDGRGEDTGAKGSVSWLRRSRGWGAPVVGVDRQTAEVVRGGGGGGRFSMGARPASAQAALKPAMQQLALALQQCTPPPLFRAMRALGNFYFQEAERLARVS